MAQSPAIQKPWTCAWPSPGRPVPATLPSFFSYPMFPRSPRLCQRIYTYLPAAFREASRALIFFKGFQQLAAHRTLRSLASSPVFAVNKHKVVLARHLSISHFRSMATSDPRTLVSPNAASIASAHPLLSKVEESKRRAAYQAVEDNFDPSYKYIGIGSGSTVVYVVEAIAAKGKDVTSKMTFIPTGKYCLGERVFRCARLTQDLHR